MQKKLVLFDIDGTLITRGRPNSPQRRFFHFEYAVEKVYGIKHLFDNSRHYGSIDREIISEELTRAGFSPNQIEERLDLVYQAVFEQFKISATPDYSSRLIPEAAVLVQQLATQYYLGLLTGNIESVGRYKVKLVGLGEYFGFGVFGDLAENRVKLAQLVPDLALNYFTISFIPKNIYIIGDTPKDVECGKAIGATTIAVATGKYSVSELQKTNADVTVPSLRDPRVFKLFHTP